ncbi:hypothetical protein [Helicobacter vulpis]|uniref:hypothetical protein n=1 Tax=Helicobacter vulpis TaxID=2316076 RepID=UPI000EAFC974|nr:hypothetical protein [Helicobacter vulpis]
MQNRCSVKQMFLAVSLSVLGTSSLLAEEIVIEDRGVKGRELGGAIGGAVGNVRERFPERETQPREPQFHERSPVYRPADFGLPIPRQEWNAR